MMEPKGWVKFNGVNLSDFGVYVSGTGIYDIPKRKYEIIKVPGHTGNFFNDEEAWEDVKVSYPAFITAKDEASFWTNYDALRRLLIATPVGYYRIEDSYEPDMYRLGYFSGNLRPQKKSDTTLNLTIEFTCIAKKFYKEADPVTAEVGTHFNIYNPGLPSYPIVRTKITAGGDRRLFVNSNGVVNDIFNFSFGSGTDALPLNIRDVITSSDPNAYIEIDPETSRAFAHLSDANVLEVTRYVAVGKRAPIPSGPGDAVIRSPYGTGTEVTTLYATFIPKWWTI